MTQELGRRLIDGVWKTDVEDEGDGGSQSLAEVLAVGNDAGTIGITNLPDPDDPQDAATKNYVDSGLGASPLAAVLNAGNDAEGNNIDNGGEFAMDSATISGSLAHNGTAVGFYGASPTVQQTYDSGGSEVDRIAQLENILTSLGLALDTP